MSSQSSIARVCFRLSLLVVYVGVISIVTAQDPGGAKTTWEYKDVVNTVKKGETLWLRARVWETNKDMMARFKAEAAATVVGLVD